MKPNERLLAAIKARSQKRTEFGYGIMTADRHVQNMVDACGMKLCRDITKGADESFTDCLEKAKDTLTYANPEMRIEKQWETWTKQDLSDLGLGNVEIPRNTLMIVKHVLTTPKKDRDGDVLRTDGAMVDPEMLILWQHVHTLPVGKMLGIAEHTANKLSLYSAFVDMPNGLGQDSAVMAANGMCRFSHGFRALMFEELKEDEGEVTSPGGFDIKQFEIMEGSVVSVPANTDAQVEEVMLDMIEGNRLTSSVMKEYGKQLRSNRSVQVHVKQQLGEYSIEATATGAGALDNAVKALKGVQDDDERKQEEEGSASTSKETEAAGSQESKSVGETSTTCDEKRMSGPLEGSWEWIRSRLESQLKRFMTMAVADVRDRDWVYPVGTFSDHAIVCVEKPESNVPDEFRYYRADWEMVDGEPKFAGDPVQVEIVTSIEELEREFGIVSQKSREAQEKRGQRLSRATRGILMEVKGDIDELMDREELSRGGTAMCKRCSDKLAALLDEGEENEASVDATLEVKQMSADDAAKVFVAVATEKQISTFAGVLSNITTQNKRKNRAAALRRKK